MLESGPARVHEWTRSISGWPDTCTGGLDTWVGRQDASVGRTGEWGRVRRWVGCARQVRVWWAGCMRARRLRMGESQQEWRAGGVQEAGDALAGERAGGWVGRVGERTGG